MITLDVAALGQIDTKTLQEKMEEKKKLMVICQLHCFLFLMLCKKELDVRFNGNGTVVDKICEANFVAKGRLPRIEFDGNSLKCKFLKVTESVDK